MGGITTGGTNNKYCSPFQRGSAIFQKLFSLTKAESGGDGGDDDNDKPIGDLLKNETKTKRTKTTTTVLATAILDWTAPCLKTLLWGTLVLYILNEQKLLPKPVTAVVSKTLFWPSLPITVSKRLGKWISAVDDTVVMGGAPIGFANIPEYLSSTYNIRGVINLCYEFKGPTRKYEKLGIQQLRLPTVDHNEPSVEDLETAVTYIQQYQTQGEKVYVHCKAGHGRSAAVVFAWLLYQDPQVDRKQLNDEFCQIRNVRSTLWKQTNIKEFHSRVKSGKFQIITENEV